MHAPTQPSAQVGWAGEHVAQVLVPHEGVAGFLEDLLNLLQPHAEAAENLLHVAPLLHGDDSEVVLLVHPHQEALVVIVPGVGRSKRPRNQLRPLSNT